jgi:hypothetical protein
MGKELGARTAIRGERAIRGRERPIAAPNGTCGTHETYV